MGFFGNKSWIDYDSITDIQKNNRNYKMVLNHIQRNGGKINNRNYLQYCDNESKWF